MGFDTYKEIVFAKNNNLGNISDFYLEIFGYYLLGKRNSFYNLFKYYKRWKFNIDEKDAKYLPFLSEHDKKCCLPFLASFGELIQAFVEFEEPLFYLQNCPPRKYLKKISMFEWGNYHLKTVNQQFYILKERILKLIRTIEKITKENDDTRFLKLKLLQDQIKDYFKPILSKRHEIVHEQAFLDERLNRISAMGTKLKKTKKGNRVDWKIENNSGVDVKMKVELAKKAKEISVELENLLHFFNSKRPL